MKYTEQHANKNILSTEKAILLSHLYFDKDTNHGEAKLFVIVFQ